MPNALAANLLLIATMCLPCYMSAQTTDTLLLKARSFYDNSGSCYPSAEDSVSYARFREVFDSTDVKDTSRTTGEYQLAWIEAREGFHVRVVRGDGRTLFDVALNPPEMGFGDPLAGPFYFGDRFAAMSWAPPTGLVRYEHWYFERRP